MKQLFLRLLVLVFLYCSLLACGNKGDLYLPEKESDTAKTEQQSA